LLEAQGCLALLVALEALVARRRKSHKKMKSLQT
jgi:hypothetical protein